MVIPLRMVFHQNTIFWQNTFFWVPYFSRFRVFSFFSSFSFFLNDRSGGYFFCCVTWFACAFSVHLYFSLTTVQAVYFFGVTCAFFSRVCSTVRAATDGQRRDRGGTEEGQRDRGGTEEGQRNTAPFSIIYPVVITHIFINSLKRARIAILQKGLHRP